MTTLNPAVAKQIDWLAPHTCQELKHNLSDTNKTLLITIPEFKSVVLANPEYFDVKEKTR